MGKSYRKPYSSITGCKSAKDDKRVARQALRRMENERLRNCKDFEELVMPKRLEAAFNDVWNWGRDGKQTLQLPPDPPENNSDFELYWYERQMKWYKRLFRK